MKKILDTDKLKNFLIEQGISYESLSRKMGYNRSFISNVISGNSGISEASYNLLCLTLGVDKSTFLSTKETQLDRIERKLDEVIKYCK